MTSEINHNIRIVTLSTGENVIANFTQVREDDKFVAYQLLYPLIVGLTVISGGKEGEEEYQITYRRWNVFTPYEDFRVNPQCVSTAMPPSKEILTNYVFKLKEAGVDLSFIPNNGDDILSQGDTSFYTPNSVESYGNDETTESNPPAAAETSGPVVDS